MKIKRVKARNFLSFGEEPFEIDFTKLGNVITLAGPNGAGKSTCANAIVYGLFGKCLKGLTHEELINLDTGGKLEVEIDFDDYRLVRKRSGNGKKGELEIYRVGEDTPLQLGGVPKTQEWLERETRLNYNSFVNVAYFGQHNPFTFLAGEAKDKRAIAENLLALDRYLSYGKAATDARKAVNQKVDGLAGVYERVRADLARATQRVGSLKAQQASWADTRGRELLALEARLRAKQADLAAAGDDGEAMARYDQAQADVAEAAAEIVRQEAAAAKVSDLVRGVEDKLAPLAAERVELRTRVAEDEARVRSLRAAVARAEQQNRNMEANDGAVCTACNGVILKDNFAHAIGCNQKLIADQGAEADALEAGLAGPREQLAAVTASAAEQAKKVEVGRARGQEIQARLRALYARRQQAAAVPRPDAGAAVLVLQQQAEAARQQVEAKREEIAGGNPFDQMVADAEAEAAAREEESGKYAREIAVLERSLPYYDYWVRAFGDDGIRSFVLEEVLPALNARVNYWLQFLMDNRLKLTFDSKLKEAIERNPADGKRFVYNSLSGGQHQRVDIAISQAFAHVMMLISGNCPSLVFLDEIGTDFDSAGIHSVHKMITELARERQVIVTTHHPELLDLLANTDRLSVRMEGNFSRLTA